MSNILNIINATVSVCLIFTVMFILYTVIIKKENYLKPTISPINNIITSMQNKQNEDNHYLLTPSTVMFNKDVEFKGKLKIGENGKYVLMMDDNNNLTLNKNELPLLKFVDMEQNNNKYIDTKFCFNEDCSKFMNINKLYGITTNQELNKI
jgi:hypothetical protein